MTKEEKVQVLSECIREARSIEELADMLTERGFVKVVRCKDCEHGQPQKRIGVICEYDQNGPFRAYDSFCSCGEKKKRP